MSEVELSGSLDHEAGQLLHTLSELSPAQLEQCERPQAALLEAIVRRRHVPFAALRPTLCRWIVEHQQGALANGDVEGYLRWLSWDVLLEDSSAPPMRGREAARAFIQGLLGLYTGAEFTHQTLDVYPKQVATAEQWSRVRVSMIFGMKLTLPGGATVQVGGVDVFDFDASLWIARVTSFYRVPG